jgi:hypothetical protein
MTLAHEKATANKRPCPPPPIRSIFFHFQQMDTYTVISKEYSELYNLIKNAFI